MDVHSKPGRYDLFEFDDFRLDVADRSLMCGTRRIHLAPKTHEVLVALVSRASCLVTKGELLARIWPDVFVEEAILTVHVACLRKALGDSRTTAHYIETVSGRGYRFVAPVRANVATDAAAFVAPATVHLAGGRL